MEVRALKARIESLDSQLEREPGCAPKAEFDAYRNWGTSTMDDKNHDSVILPEIERVVSEISDH